MNKHKEILDFKDEVCKGDRWIGKAGMSQKIASGG